MTLGEFVKNYREEHKLSYRYFASIVGMSPQQIINIEKGIGNDGKPMTSTMKTYKKIANAVGIDEKEFMKMLNDDVLINPSTEKNPATESDGKKEKYSNLRKKYDQLTDQNVVKLEEYLSLLLLQQSTQDEQ